MSKSAEALGVPTASREIRRLLALGVLVLAIVMGGFFALLALANGAIDRVQAQEEQYRVERALERFGDSLASDLTTATVWDQAYANLRPGGPRHWIDAEIGTYFANNRGHDVTLVLDGGDEPFYAFRNGRSAAPAEIHSFRTAVDPMLRELRVQERRAPRPILRKATAPELAALVKGVVRWDGAYYLVAGSTVTPEVWDAPRRPGPAVVVFSAQRLDGPFLDEVGKSLLLRQVRIVAAGQPGTGAPLTDFTGAPVAKLAWTPLKPGVQVLRSAAPLILLGLLSLAAAGGALALCMRKIVGRLYDHEARLKAALAEVTRSHAEAEAANRAKSEFLAHMSHEIRTPLNGLMGMLQVIERQALPPEQAKRLGVVRESGQSLLAVLNDILDLSKIEAGKLTLDARAFDVEQLVAQTLRSFDASAEEKGLTLEIAVAPECGVRLGDDGRIRQMLANLVSNGVKFTRTGGVRVSAWADEAGVVFEVSDTGVGISPEVLPQLFAKFVQADSSTTRRYGGTGLGLAISRQLAEAMGGELSATSELGSGSAFRLELPLLPAALAPAPDDLPPREITPSLGGARVLTVDDNAVNQIVLQALLEPLQLDLTQVMNGREAVEAFGLQPFDLVLMDVQMPEMDGVAATAAIRALEALEGRPRTPVLALTANVMSHQVAEYLNAGMDGFIAKPFDAALLLGTVASALSGHIPAEDSGAAAAPRLMPR